MVCIWVCPSECGGVCICAQGGCKGRGTSKKRTTDGITEQELRSELEVPSEEGCQVQGENAWLFLL